MDRNRLTRLFFAFLLSCALITSSSQAQINYFTTMNTGPDGWGAVGVSTWSPDGTSFVWENGVLCSQFSSGYIFGKAGSSIYTPPSPPPVFFNYESISHSPLIGNTLGGAITVSYSVRMSSIGPVGLLELCYGSSPNGPWTVVSDITGPNEVCFNTSSPSFTLAEPGPVYLRFRVHLNGFYPTYQNAGFYIDNITAMEAALPACSGVPAAGTTTASLPPGCGNPAIPLTVSPSPNQAGLQYQWQKSINGSSWSDITGATTKYTSVTQSAATYYRRKTTCANSAQTAYSSTLLVTQDNPALPCYCASAATTGIGVDISNVTLGIINNSSSDGSLYGSQGMATGTADQYSTWTASTVPIPNLPREVPLPFSVSLVTGSPGPVYSKIYIDYNQDGDLLDGNELVYSSADNIGFSGQFSGTFTVPAGAVLGNTLMRVVSNSVANSLSEVNPCGTYERGETEDYRVNITPTTNCSGTPATAVASGLATVCNLSQAITLNATNLPAAGVTAVGYQWQKSAPGANSWTNIAGATTVPYTVASQASPTDYRLVVSCAVSGQSSNSNTVSVGTAYGQQCYCIPTGACNGSYYISSVQNNSGGVSNVSGCSAGGYTNYTAGPLMRPDSMQMVSLAVLSPNGLKPNLYVDWNNNGYFTDAGELVHQYGGGAGNWYAYPISFSIPVGTSVGNYRMRIQGSNSYPITDPCATVTGEVEDYTLVVSAPGAATTVPSCSGLPTAGTVSANGATTVPCTMPARTLTVTGYTTLTVGISLQWQQSTDGINFSNIAGATGASYTTAASSTTKHYRVRVSCANGGQTATSNMLTLTVSTSIPVLTVTPATASFCAGSGGVQLTANGADAYSWAPATGLSCTTCANPIASPTVATTYTVTGTNGGVCSTSVTRTVTINQRPYAATASASPAAVCPGKAVSLIGQAYNGPVSGFAGPYAPALWTTTTLNSNGSINTAGAPGQVVFTSTNNGSGTNGNHRWAVTVPVSGNVTFNWSYAGPAGGPGDDHLLYRTTAAGTPNLLPGFSTTGSANQSGTATIAMNAGEVFSFQIRSTTNNGGSAVVTVTNFSAPGLSNNAIQWYDAASGGNTVGTGGTVNLTAPAANTTYYAGAVNQTSGCPSLTRLPATVVIDSAGFGRWLGTASTSWDNAVNWCGGVPTATTDVLIPGVATVPYMPVIDNFGEIHNLHLEDGALLSIPANTELFVNGNMTKAGSGNLNASLGSLSLTGMGPQTLIPILTLANLLVGGDSVKALGGDLTITQSMSLNGGKLDLGSHTLTLGDNATSTVGSSASYIRTSQPGSGLIMRVAGTAVTFPVGNSSYNPVTLTNTGTPDNFSVGVRDEVLTEGTTGGPIDPTATYAVNRTWDVQEGTPGGSIVSLRLEWAAGNTNNAGFDYTNVYVSHYTGGTWDHDPAYPDVNNAPTATNYPGAGPYRARRDGITSFSPFTVGSAGGSVSLPVTLLELTAENEGSRNKIVWESATEISTDHYEVEKSSDGLAFAPLQSVTAIGRAYGYIAYDNEPLNGFTYYRLKMVDQDGRFAYSQVVKAFRQTNGSIALEAFPNPVTDVLAIRTHGAKEGTASLYNAVGIRVASAQVVDGIAALDAQALPAGMYLLSFRDASNGAAQNLHILKR